MLRGIDLAAPQMSAKLVRALELGRQISSCWSHCWRGGMRSEAMAWLFSMGGLKPLLLEGGYKAYRNHILADLGRKRKYIILGGLTGSGKTRYTEAHDVMQVSRSQTWRDWRHTGDRLSAPWDSHRSPSSEHFANLLFDDLAGKE
ncbi:MAG: hypothetical protein MZV63_71195 [Marinilabiliales bacterium]|nr:hypothetical protein [Marinilabiliales bacterium]